MSDDFFDDFGWEEMGMLGALAEEMSEEEKESRRLEQEAEAEEQEQQKEDEEQLEPCIYCEGPIFEPEDDGPY